MGLYFSGLGLSRSTTRVLISKAKCIGAASHCLLICSCVAAQILSRVMRHPTCRPHSLFQLLLTARWHPQCGDWHHVSWMQGAAQSCCHSGGALTLSWDEAHEHGQSGGAGTWLTAGKVGSHHETWLIPSSSPCLDADLSHGESSDLLYCVLPHATLQNPAHCQDPLGRGIAWALKLDYYSPHSWKPSESFLCRGHLFFTS